MKKLFLLLAIIFLFESCYSYRIDTKPTEMIVGKKYKIKRDNKTSKVLIKSINDSAVVVMKNWEEHQISLKEITQAKKRKFSIVKTVALPISIATIATLAVAASLQNINIGGDFKFPN